MLHAATVNLSTLYIFGASRVGLHERVCFAKDKWVRRTVHTCVCARVCVAFVFVCVRSPIPSPAFCKQYSKYGRRQAGIGRVFALGNILSFAPLGRNLFLNIQSLSGLGLLIVHPGLLRLSVSKPAIHFTVVTVIRLVRWGNVTMWPTQALGGV